MAGRLPELDISNPISGYGYIHAVELDAVLQLGETAKALELGESLLNDMQAYGMRLRLYDILRLKAEALATEGDTDGARDSLTEVVATAEAVGSARGTWQTLSALAALEAGAGNDSAQETASSRARAILGEIIEGIADSGLREAFTSQPAVRSVMD